MHFGVIYGEVYTALTFELSVVFRRSLLFSLVNGFYIALYCLQR